MFDILLAKRTFRSALTRNRMDVLKKLHALPKKNEFVFNVLNLVTFFRNLLPSQLAFELRKQRVNTDP